MNNAKTLDRERSTWAYWTPVAGTFYAAKDLTADVRNKPITSPRPYDSAARKAAFLATCVGWLTYQGTVLLGAVMVGAKIAGQLEKIINSYS